MAKPPASASGRGRPPRRPSRPGQGQGEGPPWKRRGDDDARTKQAGWGGVARKGAGRLRDTGKGDASKAFREAVGPTADWEPEVWIDEGSVAGEARSAVGRGKRPAVEQRAGARLPTRRSSGRCPRRPSSARSSG